MLRPCRWNLALSCPDVANQSASWSIWACWFWLAWQAFFRRGLAQQALAEKQMPQIWHVDLIFSCCNNSSFRANRLMIWHLAEHVEFFVDLPSDRASAVVVRKCRPKMRSSKRYSSRCSVQTQVKLTLQRGNASFPWKCNVGDEELKSLSQLAQFLWRFLLAIPLPYPFLLFLLLLVPLLFFFWIFYPSSHVLSVASSHALSVSFSLFLSCFHPLLCFLYHLVPFSFSLFKIDPNDPGGRIYIYISHGTGPKITFCPAPSFRWFSFTIVVPMQL